MYNMECNCVVKLDLCTRCYNWHPISCTTSVCNIMYSIPYCNKKSSDSHVIINKINVGNWRRLLGCTCILAKLQKRLLMHVSTFKVFQIECVLYMYQA